MPRPALASDKVRFVGDPVACVIAETAIAAKEAAEAVALDIEPLGLVGDRIVMVVWPQTEPVDDACGDRRPVVEQLALHIEAGVDRIIFVPYKYEKEQVEAVAQEIIPRLKKAK